MIWEGDTADDGDAAGIAGRRADATGAPIGGEFQVNTYTTEAQYGPAVAAAGADFVVVWTSFGSAAGDSDYAVAGQRYQGPFFADGFESGDTSAWQ